MTAPWVSAYVGIPYRFAGRDRSGCDCWGLVRLVLSERFGIVLPSFAEDYAGGDRDALAALVSDALPLVGVDRVEDPREGDIVLLRLAGQPCHVGLVVGGPGERNLLHTLTAHDSALDYYDGHDWIKRKEGFYRVR